MKTPIVATALLIAVFASSAATAERGSGYHKDPEKRLERMTQNLDLSEQQVEEVRVLHQEMTEFWQQHQKKMQTILTEEQWQKLQARKQQRIQQGKGKKNQGNGD
jgi:Spy/CpxP family protein refolding chaperone